MSAKFAYSLNGENFVGSFASREEAKSAALAKSCGMVDPPVSVFVGKMFDGDPQATGHADEVIDSIRRRVCEADGADAGRLFGRLADSQVRDLDGALARAITAWMDKNNLMPAPKKMAAISEHTVPMPHREPSPVMADEVHDLGVEE